MMMPVGRLTIIRTFPKSELLGAMNFVILPALIGPLLGPTVGGLIVHWTSWRAIFFVNVPVGLLALYLVWRHMPDYRGAEPRPLDVIGLILFSSGTAILSWLLEVFGEHTLDGVTMGLMLSLSIALLAAYVWHASREQHPLLRLALLKVRTFRISVMGGFITRLGVGGLPFLLPLLYQLGLKLPAWQSGLLMMPTAAAAMGMKLIAPKVLARFGYRQVLVVNTICIGLTIGMFSLVGVNTPWFAIAGIALLQGFFNSLQFSSMNTLAYADVDAEGFEHGQHHRQLLPATVDELRPGLGIAGDGLVPGPRAADQPGDGDQALHHGFQALAVVTVLSSFIFWRLRRDDGDSISRGTAKAATAVAQDPAPLSQA
jgi:MFS family permease